MLDPGSGNTSEALNLELRINDTAQDSIPGMQRCCMANPSLEEPYALCGAGAYVALTSFHPGDRHLLPSWAPHKFSGI